MRIIGCVPHKQLGLVELILGGVADFALGAGAHLASYVLGAAASRIRGDWQAKYGPAKAGASRPNATLKRRCWWRAEDAPRELSAGDSAGHEASGTGMLLP